LLIQNLNRAKKQHGAIPVRFLKLLVTGSGAAGKSNFIQLLLNKKFVEKHHSTNLVHAKHAVSVRTAAFHRSALQHKEVKWIEMDESLELGFLRSVIISPKNLSSTAATSSTNTTTAESGALNYVIPKQQHSMLKRLMTLIYTPPVRNSKLTAFNSMLFSSSYSDISHKPGEILNMITVLDTGGQPEYIHLLPTINIYPTVTFVVHDLTRSLNDQVLVQYSQHGEHVFVPYHLNYTNMDMIKFLMSATNDAVERPPSKFPHLVATPGSNTTSYLCMVGTHADKVSNARIMTMGNQLTALVSNTECKPAVWQRENGSVLFPVDNTKAGKKDTDDPIAIELRSRIEMVAEERDIYEFPITWMLLQVEIQQVCSERQKSYIKFEECVSIAKTASLISSSAEVKTMLLYYHLLRLLIYFENVPGLCDYVIVDHQWWFDKLSRIITNTFQRTQLDFHAVQKLKYEGILSKELLQCIKWEDDIKEEFFLSLLVHMKIIASLVTKDSNEQYFIPFILPAYNLQQKNDILSKYGCLQGEPIMIKFYSRRIPRGLFCSLIVELLQNPPQQWHHQKGKDHTFNNLVTFSLPNAFSLSLFDKLSYLEIQLRHPEEDFKISIHVQVHSQLVQALIQTCIHLNFDYSGLLYGFLCNCGNITEDHIATVPSLSQNVMFAKCSITTVHHMKLNSLHLIWFQDSNSGKQFYSFIL